MLNTEQKYYFLHLHKFFLRILQPSSWQAGVLFVLQFCAGWHLALSTGRTFISVLQDQLTARCLGVFVAVLYTVR